MHNIFQYKTHKPKIHKTSFIAPNASIIGKVSIGHHSSIWFNSVLRGDVEEIKVGDYTNIQDGTIVHVTNGGYPTNIGSYVTIGHKAIIHACTIEDYAFIGMDATMMDRSIIRSGGWLAAGALLTEDKIIESGELWIGRPAKFLRKLTEAETNHIKVSAENYARYAKDYLD
ncbi:MAG: gamma carbonic anhydrase family protein [Alphaproteobacteria bacterium]|nr:gamma carbonic anhydrase family protein [Alphaproteobacteria bacterium]